MGKRLAIRGHDTRGDEVIELLEMLGGSNIYNLLGNNSYMYYANDIRQNIIRGSKDMFDEDIQFFNLEEFLEKYPYKIGDKIPDVWENSCTVKSMRWDDNYKTVMYSFKETIFVVRGDELKPVNVYKPLFKAGDVVKLKGCPDKNLFWIVMDVVKDGYIFNDAKKIPFDEQHHYEKSNREVMLTTPSTPSKMKNVLAELLEHIKATPKEELEKEFKEIEEWSNVGPTVEEFMTFCETVNKKLVYPKTYDECCELLGKTKAYQSVSGYKTELLEDFQKLLICRDAYWKIAGEQMGLDEPWEPDWSNDDETKFCIYTTQNIISLDVFGVDNRILAFPTEEMRDAFYENFKKEIEQCKEFL